MPRPKVKPENRQRCLLACLPCKKLKIRCDAHTPCATCTKRGRQNTCIYQDSNERTSEPVRRRRSTNASHRTERATPRFGTEHRNVDSDPVTKSSEDCTLRSRTLLSSKFQHLYVGEAASLSYLQFVREVVKQRLGGNAFSEGEFSSFMLESDVKARAAAVDSSESMPDHLVPVFVQSYLDATSGVLELFNNDEIFESVDDPSSSLDSSCRHLVLAIGAQCRGLLPADLSFAATSFGIGQKLAFADFLCDPSLDMARRFLLMAFYMTAACHRNAAFMYLGVAWKAACALGLHRADQYHRLSSDECVTRLKTWRSLRILDTIVNSILGRSSGTAGLPFDPRLEEISSTLDGLNGTSAREHALRAAFSLCPFMDEFERGGTAQDPALAKDFVRRLRLWNKALPQELRRLTDAIEAADYSAPGESFVGAAHTACMYCFAIIQSTRRFFTLHLVSLVKASMTARPFTSPKSPANGSRRVEELALICLQAAKNLANVGRNILSPGRTVNNMCLMKAWVFAAGLLLGFWLFATCDAQEAEIVHAFQQSRVALQSMAAFSPQARHYHGILNSLSDAIELHRCNSNRGEGATTSGHANPVPASPKVASPSGNGMAISGRLAQNSDRPSTPLGSDQATPSSIDVLTFQEGSYILNDMSGSEGFLWPADDLELDWIPFAPFLHDLT